MKVAARSIRLPTRGAVVSSAEVVPPAGAPGTPDYLPEHCAIRGEIAPVDSAALPIRFGIAAPLAWNGRAVQLGGNGMLGFVPWLAALNRNGAGSPQGPTAPPDTPYPLALGYVIFGDDGGHVTGSGTAPGRPGGVPPSTGQATMGGPPPGPPDYDWAANRETWLNFAHHAIRKDYDASRAIISALYGKTPVGTYYLGESHGGRQAMAALGHYGEDYTGAYISVPLAYLTELWLRDFRNARLQAAPGGYIPAAKYPAIERETIRRCDALDGLTDGVVLNYKACATAFDPVRDPAAMAGVRCPDGKDSGDACLSDAQIVTVNGFRSPVALGYEVAGLGRSYPGAFAGGEASVNWMGARTPPVLDGSNGGSPHFGLIRRVIGAQDASVLNIEEPRFQQGLKRMSTELDPPTDWTRFFARGGKVIWHTASADYLTNAAAHIAAFEAMLRQSGARAKIASRLYVTPVGDHGSRSFSFPDKTPQPRQMDLVAVLTDWVERGRTPPDAVKQVLMDVAPPHAVSRSRPLCQYPDYPRYRGSGDPASFDSYRCTAP
jgi:feruloyl esterase